MVAYSVDKTLGIDSRKLRLAIKSGKSIEESPDWIAVDDCRVMLHGASFTPVLIFERDGKTYAFKIDRQWMKKAKRDYETFSTILRTAGLPA